MADVFKLLGSYTTAPYSGAPSAAPTLAAVLDEQLALKAKSIQEYRLEADPAQVVDFGGLAAAHVLIVKCVGGKAKLRLTSADGVEQVIPVDSFAMLFSESVPYTALDLTREAGIEVTATIFLGEKA